jgi:uncharacterized protein YegL
MSLDQTVRHPIQAGVTNPVVLVLDASETLNGQVEAMYEYVRAGFAKAARTSEVFERVEVAVVLINRDRAIPLQLGPDGEPFVPVAHLRLPTPPEGAGVTPLHDAVDLALDMIADEHQRLAAAGRMRGVATLIIASDGRPTDAAGEPTAAWHAAAARLRAERERQLVLPAALAFGGADMATLEAFAPRVVIDGSLDDLADIISIATLSIDRAADGAATPVYAIEDLIRHAYDDRFEVGG